MLEIYTKSKKCKHCKKPRGEHNALNLACPVRMKWHGFVGYMQYSAFTTFTPRETTRSQGKLP